MIRLVIAVVVGVAVIAAALPAVEAVRADRSDARLTQFVERLGAATDRIAGETPTRVGPGPRRAVVVRLPEASLGLAPVSTARVRCGDRRGLAVTYRLAGEHRERSVAVPVPAAIRSDVDDTSDAERGPTDPDRRTPDTGRGTTDTEPEAVVADGDRLRVHLGFRLLDDRPTVTVAPAGGSSRIPGPLVPCSTRSEKRTRPPVGAGPI